jgi:hypothetical protein
MHETVVWCERGHRTSNLDPYRNMPLSKQAFIDWLTRKPEEGASDADTV